MAAAAFGRLQAFRPAWQHYQSTRGMATLKAIAIRLKSVKNIEKITKSMKMVSAAKYGQAERELQPARTYGQGAMALFEKAEVLPEPDERKPNHLVIAISSDRGLCGGIHSSISKSIKAALREKTDEGTTALVIVGDKARSILQRTHRKNMLLTFKEIGKKPPVFVEASFIAQQILNSGFEYDSAELVFNRFRNVVSYSTSHQPVVPLSTLSASEKMLVYDDVDAEVMQCYHEMTLANTIFYTMKEGACSEQSSRMTAMGSASKNAGEMIDRLTLLYNRQRQAVITRELIEVISGAAAV